MDELQELIRRIKNKASQDLNYDGQCAEPWEFRENGVIEFCRELCSELDLDAHTIQQSILRAGL